MQGGQVVGVSQVNREPFLDQELQVRGIIVSYSFENLTSGVFWLILLINDNVRELNPNKILSNINSFLFCQCCKESLQKKV